MGSSFKFNDCRRENESQYHKKNTVEITYSASEVKILADEIMVQQCLRHWISYVNEFVQESAAIHIQTEELPEACQIIIRSSGAKHQSPPECDLTLYGFVAKGILDLHRGKLIQLEEQEQGALVQFIWPKAF